MKISLEQLTQKLAAGIGAGSVSADATARASCIIDGVTPSLVCLPGDSAAVAALLRICADAGATVAPYGGGTAIAIGNRPAAIDVALDLRRLNRLLEHDDANLTTTAEAGMTLSRLQDLIAGRKQFLPIDAPHPERATLGGIIAANLNGQRRSAYGAIRDLLIGIEVALATGERAKAGGKVVKNVAGYDMCKLFVGSLGTLGVMTRVTLRTSPLPETAATWVASGSLTEVADLARDIARSPLLPAAVVIMNSPAGRELHGGGGWSVAVWCEGFSETVARHLRDLTAMAGPIRTGISLFRNGSHRRFWGLARDFPLPSGGLVFRMTVPRAAITTILGRVESREAAGFSPALLADVMAGTLWIAAPPDDAAAGHFQKLSAFAGEVSGHAVMLVAPPDIKASVDVWGSPPPALALMRRVKKQFDPGGMLNPGRYVSGM